MAYAKKKPDGRTDGQTDKRTDGRTFSAFFHNFNLILFIVTFKVISGKKKDTYIQLYVY